MFKNNKIDLGMINTSSKMSLKMSCINACKGDVQRAKELYDFLSEGIEAIPDFDIQQPTMMQQVQQTVGNIFGWVKDNREDIVQAVGFIQSLRGGTSSQFANAAPIPPLPTE